MNEQNLRTPTTEEARQMQLKSAQKRKENNAKKKLMSTIYADFLEKEYNVKTPEGTKKISGEELCNEAMKKIMARSDSSSVSLMAEIRKALEGEKVNLAGTVATQMETTEDRVAQFEKLVGDK